MYIYFEGNFQTYSRPGTLAALIKMLNNKTPRATL